MARRCGNTHHQPVRHHRGAAGDRAAVAAGFADHRGGFTGDGTLVDAGDAFDDIAVGGHHVAGFHQHEVTDLQLRGGGGPEQRAVVGAQQQLGHRVGAGAAQAFRARAATAFGNCLGEGRGTAQSATARTRWRWQKPQGWPVTRLRTPSRVTRAATTLGDEDHRVAHQGNGVELAERVPGGAGDDGAVEQRDRLRATRRGGGGCHDVILRRSCRTTARSVPRSVRATGPA